MTSHVDEQVEKVVGNVDKWANLPDARKLEYLKEIQANLVKYCDEWGMACAKARNYESVPALHGIGWAMGPTIMAQHLQCLINTYEALVKTGKPPQVKTRKVGDQVVAQVFPLSMMDKVLLPIESELWLMPGKEATQGGCRGKKGVCAVLSAGNYEAPIDIFYKMFVESHVVVYGRHPNVASSNSYIERLFECLVADGFLSIVEPGIPNSSALVAHEKVDEVLMTGGAATFDKIVWGSDEAKAAGKRRLNKTVEAELGAVSPYIIVPCDDWTEKELQHHARALVGFKLTNSSAVCASPQLLVLGKEWKHRARFMELVEQAFETMDKTPVFYKGSNERVEAGVEAYAGKRGEVYRVKAAAGADDFYVRPAIVKNLEEEDIGSFSTRNECFAPLLLQVSVSSDGEEDFIKKVTTLVNSDKVFGSLSCSMIVHAATEKRIGKEKLDLLLQQMEWGTIAVNHWGGMGPLMGNAMWGAFPKHTPENIQSGIGILGNYLMFDHPQRQVLRSIFINPVHPKGPPSAKDGEMYKALAQYNAYPSCFRLSRLVYRAVCAML